LSPDAARAPALETPRRRPQLQDRRRPTECKLQYDLLPHPPYLRKAPGPLQVRSRRQGAAPAADQIARYRRFFPAARAGRTVTAEFLLTHVATARLTVPFNHGAPSGGLHFRMASAARLRTVQQVTRPGRKIHKGTAGWLGFFVAVLDSDI